MQRARWTLAMCDRFGCLPGALGRESTRLLRLLRIEGLASGEEVTPDGQ